MKIEIYTSNRNGTTVSGLQTDFSSLINSSENLINTLNTIKSTTFVISGGVGALQNAISSVEQRIVQEEARKVNLENAKSKTDKFIELALSTDHNVARIVSQNKDEFYHLNSWSKPSFLKEATMKWYSNAKKWLADTYKEIKDEFTHNWDVATEIDFRDLSDEEIKELCDLYVDKINSGELTSDDIIRIKLFLEYFSNIKIRKKLSDSDRIKISCYNELYEKFYEKSNSNENIDEKVELSKFFSNNTSSDTWTDEEIMVISYLAYSSKSPQHDLLFKYIGQCTVSDFSATHDDGSSGCWYSPADHTIHLNRNEFLDYNLGAYHVIFQEIGHNIDDLIYNGYKDKDLTTTSDRFATGSPQYGERINEALRKDVSNLIWNTIDSYNDNEAVFGISGPGKQKIYDVLMGNAPFSSLNPRLKWAYGKIYEDISGHWPDVFGNGKIFTWFDGTIVGNEDGVLRDNSASAADAVASQTHGTIGSGHESDYWNNKYFDNLEVFSEYFASGICNRKDFERSKNLLPNTYRALDELAKNSL